MNRELENRHGLRALEGVYEEILQGAARAQEFACKCVFLLMFCNLASFHVCVLFRLRERTFMVVLLKITVFEMGFHRRTNVTS